MDWLQAHPTTPVNYFFGAGEGGTSPIFERKPQSAGSQAGKEGSDGAEAVGIDPWRERREGVATTVAGYIGNAVEDRTERFSKGPSLDAQRTARIKP